MKIILIIHRNTILYVYTYIMSIIKNLQKINPVFTNIRQITHDNWCDILDVMNFNSLDYTSTNSCAFVCESKHILFPNNKNQSIKCKIIFSLTKNTQGLLKPYPFNYFYTDFFANCVADKHCVDARELGNLMLHNLHFLNIPLSSILDISVKYTNFETVYNRKQYSSFASCHAKSIKILNTKSTRNIRKHKK